MSSPLLNAAVPSTSTASIPAPSISNSAEEENADEVKIFRTDVDDVNNDEPLDDELVADKTDVAFEADTDMGERSAFSTAQPSSVGLLDNEAARQHAFKVLAQMAFPPAGFMFPFLQSPFSPLSPMYSPQAATLANMANMVRNSPSHVAANLYAAAALSGGAFGAGVNPFTAAFGAPPILQPLAGGAATSGGGAFSAGRLLPSTPTRFDSGAGALNSPVSSMSVNLNGMSLHNRNAYKSTHTTPKRGGAAPYGLHSAPGSASQKTPKQERGGGGGEREEKPVHIKKPCNAFMWYMKKNRKRLLDELGGQQIQSASINRRLGEEWQKLSKEQQQEYFKMASEERELHQKLHPDWTARDNYAIKKNKKKKSREKSSENNDQKKCRARFGVENQAKWCKHCKRKKRCLNVRDADSPVHVVSSTTPGHMPPGGSAVKAMLDGLQRHAAAAGSAAPLHALNAHAQISSASSTASSSTVSRHLDSPSSSGVMSVGKRTESNASSNFDGSGASPPPPGSSSSSAASHHAAAAATSANNPLNFLQSLQHHPQFTQLFSNCATPKAESRDVSANATPLAPKGAAPAIRDDVEMPKPTHLLAQFHQQQQQQQQQQYHQQHQQLFNNFNFNPMDPSHNFMAYAAAAAFTPQNLK